MPKDWKTTTVGILTGLVVICESMIALLDNDPSTVFDANNILKSVVGIGLIIWGIVAADSK